MFNWEAGYITTSYLQVSFGDARLFHTELQIFHFSVKQGRTQSFPPKATSTVTHETYRRSMSWAGYRWSQTTHLFSSSSWLSSSTLSRSAASTSERSWSNFASISTACCNTETITHLMLVTDCIFNMSGKNNRINCLSGYFTDWSVLSYPLAPTDHCSLLFNNLLISVFL